MDRFHLLTGGVRTLLPRQQTLQASVDWSYNLLGEDERALLRRLSVFVGSFTLDAAEQVCSEDGIERYQVLELLSCLVDRSLVQVEEAAAEARYRRLETIRQYGRDRLAESGEEAAARTRHLDFYVALAERAEPEMHGPQQIVWLDRLEREHDNFRGALEWAVGHLELEAAMRLCTALGWFWWLRGYLREANQWLTAALAAAHQRAAVPLRVRAKALSATV